MIRISNGVARLTTSRPMLPRPTTPSVLPRSSVPRNFFFSHLPDLVETLACGMERASAQHEGDRVLGHRNSVAAGRVHHQHAGGGGGLRSTLSTPTPARPITRSFGAFASTSGVHLDRAAHDQRVARWPDAAAYSLGFETMMSQPGCACSKFDAGRSQRFSD